MNVRQLEQLIIGAVALHSLILGVAMLLFPTWMLGLVSWEYDGPAFFPSQSGIFLLILGGAYTAALWHQHFAWFLVASKAAAVAFLIGHVAVASAPPIILLQAISDGLMCAAVLCVVMWRIRSEGDCVVKSFQPQ